VIAVFICFLAVWIYHYHNKHRYLAYILFTISVQLKVFPFIFIVLLIGNWQDRRKNIKRLLMLAVVNLALLFVLGPYVFVDFMKAIIAQTVNPDIGPGNHSTRSFVTLLSYKHGWVWMYQYLGWAQFALLAVIADCIFLIMLHTSRQKQGNINPLLLLACTIGALLIPSVSIDYKLSILAAPVAVLFANNNFWESLESRSPRIIFGVPLLIFSAAYSSTLFSFTNKPLLLENSFPVLIAMLLAITFISSMNYSSRL
jgi:predicted branched-subunit amino acid permease